MNNTYTIKDIVKLLMSRAWLILLFVILGGISAFGLSKFMLPLMYESHITMYVQSYQGVAEGAGGNVNNISNSKQLVNTYMEVLKDDAVMNSVGELLESNFGNSTLSECFSMYNGKISPASISKTLTISSVTDTSAVKVSSVTRNPEVSAAVCNYLTLVAPKYVQQAVGVGSLNTIDKAKVYTNPVSPKIMKNTVLGAAAAFLIIVLIIFLIDFFDNTVKETDKVSKKYGKAIMGEIQQFSEAKKHKGRTKAAQADGRALITDQNIPFNIAESYKSIRTNVMFAMGTSDKKIVAISSPNPGDGKSTSAANIAIAFAQTNSKVLLIDADMRKPVQHRIFKVKNSEGLSTLIIKKSTPSRSIKENVMKNLDLLPSGPTPPNPSELLASEQFATMLEQFAIVYDYIIIDTPPLNVVSDAMVMKESINGILLVFKHGQTTYDEIDNCMKQMELTHTNLIGFLMNEVAQKRHSSYYSKYKEYGYGSSAQTTKKGSKENAD